MNLSKQEFLNCGESAKYIQANHNLRQQLESDVAEWLASGGMIKDLGGVGNVPKPEHIVEDKDVVSIVKSRMLRMRVRKFGRVSAPIRELSGVSLGRFGRFMNEPEFLITKQEYKAISDAVNQLNSGVIA